MRDEEQTEVSVQQNATDTNHHSESNEVIDDNNYSTSPVEPQSAVHPILGQDAVDSSDCQETENEYWWRKVSAAADDVSGSSFQQPMPSLCVGLFPHAT